MLNHPSNNGSEELSITIHGGVGSDEHAIEKWARSLRFDLLQLGADNVRFATEIDAASQAGAKGDPFSWGVLIVALTTSVIPKVIEYIQSRASGDERRKIRLKVGDDELELTDVSSPEQTRLANEWIARRHGKPSVQGQKNANRSRQ